MKNFYWKDGIFYDKDVNIALHKILLTSFVLSNKDEVKEMVMFYLDKSMEMNDFMKEIYNSFLQEKHLDLFYLLRK